jgi:hypothetical protein
MEAFTSLAPILGVVLIGSGAFIVAFRLRQGLGLGGPEMAIVATGFAAISFPYIYPLMLKMAQSLHVFDGEAPTPQSEPEPDPEPEPPAAETSGPPIDAGWVWLIIAALVLVALLVTGIVVLLKYRAKLTADKVAARAAEAERVGRVQRILDRHDASLDDWRMHTADDIDLILRHPMLADVATPVVAAHLRAMEKARDLRPSIATSFAGEPVGSAYDEAVSALEAAWKKALAEAHSVNDAGMTEEERKLLRQARKVWKLVSNRASTPDERATAAGRLEKLMRRLRLADEHHNPDLLGALEQAKDGRKMLTAGPGATAVAHESADTKADLESHPSLSEVAGIMKHRFLSRLRSSVSNKENS